MRRLGVGLVQRELERQRVGAAVALHDDAHEPDQRRAVVPARIHPPLERHQRRIGERGGELAQRIARELGLQEFVEDRDETLGRLQRDVADEAVADDDVGRSLVDVVALDVAVEVEARGLEQLGGRLRRRRCP